ncbi:ribonuclease HI [Candidatus Peregrinibacteria bacterium]|nr:ribonuclease HI [Candidatus Peregrinibacteria bacterium]
MSIQIFTDGSSLGNPGPGGFCAIIKKGARTFVVKGGEVKTTNNRMEMSAIIAGLYYAHKKIPTECEVEVFSDSSLIIETMRRKWKRKKNLDLWAKLDAITVKFDKLKWHWIRGHGGHPENEAADRIAVLEAKKRLP